MQKGNKSPKQKSEKLRPAFADLIGNIAGDKDIRKYRKGAKLFVQGAEPDAIYFIRSGKVKVTVVSTQGKEAVLAMMGPRDFLGESCLADAARRTSTATCIEASSIVRIGKREMLKELNARPELCENFVASLLSRNLNLEEDLCDQLFNHTERRLARVLLRLSRSEKHDKLPNATIPGVTSEALAEFVGTSRARINFFMNKFKKLGLIDYQGKGDITLMPGLLTDIVLHD